MYHEAMPSPSRSALGIILNIVSVVTRVGRKVGVNGGAAGAVVFIDALGTAEDVGAVEFFGGRCARGRSIDIGGLNVLAAHELIRPPPAVLVDAGVLRRSRRWKDAVIGVNVHQHGGRDLPHVAGALNGGGGPAGLA